jgi:hypothetical protein
VAKDIATPSKARRGFAVADPARPRQIAAKEAAAVLAGKRSFSQNPTWPPRLAGPGFGLGAQGAVDPNLAPTDLHPA